MLNDPTQHKPQNIEWLAWQNPRKIVMKGPTVHQTIMAAIAELHVKQWQREKQERYERSFNYWFSKVLCRPRIKIELGLFYVRIRKWSA